MRLVRLLAFSVALAACGFGAELQPPETEELFASEGTRVTMTLVDRGGFPDRVVDYTITAHGAYGDAPVLSGWAQVQQVAHQARATRLSSSSDFVAIALRDELCLLDARGFVTCIDVAAIDRGTRTMGAVTEALWWRASDPECDGTSRAHAEAALALLHARPSADHAAP